MSQGGFDAFAGMLGITAGVVSFVVLGYVERCAPFRHLLCGSHLTVTQLPDLDLSSLWSARRLS